MAIGDFEAWVKQVGHQRELIMPSGGEMAGIDRALKIEGFMESTELLWLAMQASTRGLIVELGCWRGRSTRALGDNTPGVVYAVDKWVVHEPELAGAPDGFSDTWLYDEFTANLKDLIGEKVLPQRMDGTEAARALFCSKGRVFDMAFIDGNHETYAVRADIKNYRRLLRPGGLLCGHDYNLASVQAAVCELLGMPQVYHNIWWVQV